MNETKPVSLDMKIRGMGLSATLAISERCRRMRSEGRAVCDMGLGQSPFPVPVSVVEALRFAAHEKDYLPVRGLRALRDAVAEFHAKQDHIAAHPKGVIIGPGSKELMFLLQVAFYGEIIVTSPCWVSYLPQARILGRRNHVIQTTFDQCWKITPDQLQETMETEHDDYRPRLLVLNYPANPTGQSYTEDELSDIADVARRFQIIILSDEIYGQLHHQGQHVSIARFYPEGTIVSSGLSKWCGAGGWRLGTFCFPPDLYWLLDAMASVASETYTTVSAPIQHAAVHAFRGGVDIERYLWHARRILAALGGKCASILQQAGVALHWPVGAFYLYPDFSPLRDRLAARGIHDSITLCERLLEEVQVAALPGASFAQPRSELTVRMAYVDFDGARALAASENIPLHDDLPEDCIQDWCHQLLAGVDRIAHWLNEPQAD